MRTFLLTLASLSFLSACASQTETVLVRPEIPADLLTPCPISERQAITLRDLSILATEHLASAQCANAKIEALALAVGPQ